MVRSHALSTNVQQQVMVVVVVAQGNPGIGSIFYVDGVPTSYSMTLSDPPVVALKSDSEANV